MPCRLLHPHRRLARAIRFFDVSASRPSSRAKLPAMPVARLSKAKIDEHILQRSGFWLARDPDLGELLGQKFAIPAADLTDRDADQIRTCARDFLCQWHT